MTFSETLEYILRLLGDIRIFQFALLSIISQLTYQMFPNVVKKYFIRERENLNFPGAHTFVFGKYVVLMFRQSRYFLRR